MNQEKDSLKKIIKYRLSYSGMKETDILYKKLIYDKLDFLGDSDLKLLSDLFHEVSDAEIFYMLTNKKIKLNKFKDLINKILDE